jgi:metal-responsive CopG/Arc/MetJ family transcriptional regulator
MASVDKIAISVDRELLVRAEKVRAQTGETRSALLSRALRVLIDQEELQDRVAEYVEGYRRAPEQAGEVALAAEVARRSLAAVPWEEE